MDRLVESCVDFFIDNVEEISNIPDNIVSINSGILKYIAKNLSLERIEGLKERKGKFVSRLWMLKLELLMEEKGFCLHRCIHCNKLFTMEQQGYLPQLVGHSGH